MRRIVLLAGVFLVAAGATAVLSRERWPGPHPNAIATYALRWDSREAEWTTSTFPPDTPPASRFDQVLKAMFAPRGYRMTYIDLSAPDVMRSFRMSAPLDPPVALAGRTPSEVIRECVVKTGFAGEIDFVWTDLGLLITRPQFASDLNLAHIDAGPLYSRWWSPRLLWSRMSAPEGRAPSNQFQLLNKRVELEVAPDSWARPGVEGGGTYGISGNTVQVINTNANVATVQDLIWRIKLEALIFDSSVIGLTAAFPLALGMLIHSTIRRRRRRKLGHCLACGYDLRGSPDRCPECGLVSSSQDGATAVAS